MQETILVTGASGFLGGHVVDMLLAAGYAVRCQYRRATPPNFLMNARQHDADLVRLNLQQATDSDLDALCNGVDYVIHAASLVSDWGPKKRFFATNVTATANLLAASVRAHVRRFAYVSSIAVHGLAPCEQITEEGPYNRLYNLYAITKKRAEECVVATRGIETTIIRPGSIYGPRDVTAMYRIFDLIKAGFMVYLGSRTRLAPIVYVDDVAQAIRLSLTSADAPGRAFNITSGEKIQWDEYFGMVAEALGVRPPAIVIPKWAAYLCAFILGVVYRMLFLRSAPPITTFRIRSMLHSRYFDISNARRYLGYAPATKARDGVPATVAAYTEFKKPSKRA